MVSKSKISSALALGISLIWFLTHPAILIINLSIIWFN